MKVSRHNSSLFLFNISMDARSWCMVITPRMADLLTCLSSWEWKKKLLWLIKLEDFISIHLNLPMFPVHLSISKVNFSIKIFLLGNAVNLSEVNNICISWKHLKKWSITGLTAKLEQTPRLVRERHTHPKAYFDLLQLF